VVARPPLRLRIEPMRIEDLPEVHAIERASFDAPWPPEAFVELLASPGVFALAAMDAARVLTTQALHESPDRHVSHLQGEMDRIDFPAECVHACATAGQHRCEEPLEYRVVGGVGEDGLTGVTTLNDVVNTSGHMKSGSA